MIMACYNCTFCNVEEDTGFLGGKSMAYGHPICENCLQKWELENTKPITEQSESHLNKKISLITASRERISKSSTDWISIIANDPGNQAMYQSQLTKLQGDMQIIQNELQRRATTAQKTIIQEHVLLFCRYCGTKYDQLAAKCPSCGALTR